MTDSCHLLYPEREVKGRPVWCGIFILISCLASKVALVDLPPPRQRDYDVMSLRPVSKTGLTLKRRLS